jgi:hypothetical protein
MTTCENRNKNIPLYGALRNQDHINNKLILPSNSLANSGSKWRCVWIDLWSCGFHHFSAITKAKLQGIRTND